MILNTLLVLIVFLGIVIGLVLNKLVREEMKLGRKYFLWLEKALFVAIIVSLIVLSGGFSFFSLIFLIVGFFVAFLLKETYFYLGLGLVLAFISDNKDYLAVIASFIFVIGLVFGALKDFKKENVKRIFLFSVIGFFIVFVLFWFKGFVLENLNYFGYFAVGGLLKLLVINRKLFKLKK